MFTIAVDTVSFFICIQGRGEKYCGQRVCFSVCSRVSKTTCLNFMKFSAHVTMAIARCSSDNNATRYPILWMTSRFHNMHEANVQNQGRRAHFLEFALSQRRFAVIRVLLMSFCIEFHFVLTCLCLYMLHWKINLIWFEVFCDNYTCNLGRVYDFSLPCPRTRVRSIAVSFSVCPFACGLAYLKNHMPQFHQILCTCYP